MGSTKIAVTCVYCAGQSAEDILADIFYRYLQRILSCKDGGNASCGR